MTNLNKQHKVFRKKTRHNIDSIRNDGIVIKYFIMAKK